MKKKLTDFDITVLSGEHFYACFETKKLAVTECLVKFPDGVKKYLTLNAIPILDKAGQIDGAFYVWVDYTELHEKMDAVKKIEQRVDRIIQENPYPLFTIDPNLDIKIANQAFLKLTGVFTGTCLHPLDEEFQVPQEQGSERGRDDQVEKAERRRINHRVPVGNLPARMVLHPPAGCRGQCREPARGVQ